MTIQPLNYGEDLLLQSPVTSGRDGGGIDDNDDIETNMPTACACGTCVIYGGIVIQ